jgi:hypothetical protein
MMMMGYIENLSEFCISVSDRIGICRATCKGSLIQYIPSVGSLPKLNYWIQKLSIGEILYELGPNRNTLQ